MKLELEFPSASSTVNPNFAAIAANYSEMPELLQAGINFAKEGKREEARLFLWRVASAEPQNETAWLWLASISEYPEELLVFLQNVLNINPTNERALEWQTSTKAMMSNTFVERGINASQSNQIDLANQCFMQALLHDSQNENAWLRLASIAESSEEKISYLNKVVEINPENGTALVLLKSLQYEISQSLLKKANFAAISGERQTARELLEQVMQNAPELEEAWMLKAYLADGSEEKVTCYEKILSLNPENEAAQAGLASLQALMQRSMAQKSNVEAIQEVFASSGARVLEPEKTVEFSVEAQEFSAEAEEVLIESEEVSAPINEFSTPINEFSTPVNEFATETHEFSIDADDLEVLEVEELEILDEPLFEDEDAHAEEFILDSPDDENDSPKQFENPTDELDANFVEEVKAQGGFAHLQEIEAVQESAAVKEEPILEEAETILEESEPTFYSANEETADYSFSEETAESIEIPEPKMENADHSFHGFSIADETISDVIPTVEAADHSANGFAYEDSSIFGGVNLEMPVEIQLAPTEEALLPEVESHSHEESLLPEVESHSYETTVLSSNYLEKVAAESENFSSFVQVSAVEESPVMQEEFTQNVDSTYVDSSYVEPSYTEPSDVDPSSIEVKSEESEMEPAMYRTPMAVESMNCPFCYSTNEAQAFVCGSCNLILSLSDMEMILAHTGAKADVLDMAIEDLEAEREIREMSEEELTNLGIAYLHAKNLRKALHCLQEASQINPNNIVLGSKVNFLAIRLSEIEAQESKAEGVVTKTLTIMVVDDSPTVRKLISGKLEKSGHVVITAADGYEAMEKIEEIIPDLVLLDIMMPQMDGYQVCKLIRSNETTKEVPVIMISGKDGFFDKVRGRMAGTTGYITKPFGPETLMKTIEAYVS